MRTKLKCIFIPFYAMSYYEKKDPSGIGSIFGMFYGVFLSIYIVTRFSIGISSANDPKECILRSIGDVLVTPMYALGCNIGKDRFEIKVN